MNLYPTIKTALETVLTNTWAVELPENPIWPAIVFEIESTPEDFWCKYVRYEQHVVDVLVHSMSHADFSIYEPLVRAAMGSISSHIDDEEHGDDAYEKDPEVFVYFMRFRFRTREFLSNV